MVKSGSRNLQPPGGFIDVLSDKQCEDQKRDGQVESKDRYPTENLVGNQVDKEDDQNSQQDELELTEKVKEGIAATVLVGQRTGGAVYRQQGYHQEDQNHHPDNPVTFYVPFYLHPLLLNLLCT